MNAPNQPSATAQTATAAPNMLESIAPKSNQLNADDLIGGRSITIKITKVSGVAGEQPICINYEGDNGKPYYPCKSMRRVLVHVGAVAIVHPFAANLPQWSFHA